MDSSSPPPPDFSVVVDSRPLLPPSSNPLLDDDENWHDCPTDLPPVEDVSALDALQFFRLERGSDKSGNRIFRIVGKYFPGITSDDCFVISNWPKSQ